MLTLFNRPRASRRSAVFAPFTSLDALAAVLVLAACDAAAPTESSSSRASAPAIALTSAETAEGAEREVYEALYDQEGSEVSVVCSDDTQSEPVILSGKIFERFTVVFPPTGGQHTVYHTMPVGLSGVGSVSGEPFRVKARDHGSFVQTTMSEGGSYRQTWSFVGRDSGRSFGLVVRGHVQLNANGEVVVDREKVVADCEV